MANRVVEAARLIDEVAYFRVINLGLYMRIYTSDLVRLDHLQALSGKRGAGHKKRSGAVLLQFQDEWVIYQLLKTCLPHIVERKRLVGLAVRFLEAETAGELWEAAVELQREQMEVDGGSSN